MEKCVRDKGKRNEKKACAGRRNERKSAALEEVGSVALQERRFVATEEEEGRSVA